MKILSTYSFTTAKAVVNHLQSLAEVSSRVDNSSLPISDFKILLASIRPYLLYLQKGWHKNLYFAFRRHGFEFETVFSFFSSRVELLHDILACLVLTYENGRYILSLVEL